MPAGGRPAWRGRCACGAPTTARRRGGAARSATPRCPRPTPASAGAVRRAEAELFYPDATEIRLVGGELGSGHAVAWIRLRGELLPGVAPSPLARACAAADFANGLSWILPFDEWLFVNTELTVHLHREPVGEWIGLDARTTSDASGVGLASGVLHDERGRFGTLRAGAVRAAALTPGGQPGDTDPCPPVGLRARPEQRRLRRQWPEPRNPRPTPSPS